MGVLKELFEMKDMSIECPDCSMNLKHNEVDGVEFFTCNFCNGYFTKEEILNEY